VPGTEGRFSLRSRRWDETPTPAARALATVNSLIDRYGVVLRGIATHENLPGGFGALYNVFRSLEDAGKIRSGYFVEGAGGAQFARPGADETLRTHRAPPADGLATPSDDCPRLLATTDPAQPFGSIFPWPPATEVDARVTRSSGTRVVLHRGRPLAYLPRSLTAMITFPSPDPTDAPADADAIVQAIGSWMQTARSPRALHLSTVDGISVHAHPLRTALQSLGFVRSGDGMLLRRGEARLTPKTDKRVSRMIAPQLDDDDDPFAELDEVPDSAR
jgi:ATP-dependent Lhr-like helicase